MLLFDARFANLKNWHRLITVRVNQFDILNSPYVHNAVTLSWRDDEKVEGEIIVGPDRLGDRYSNPKTSGLKVTVNAGKNVVPRYDLTDREPID